MKLIAKKISLKAIEKLAKAKFGNLVKAVVDVEKEIMVVDGELHSDEEALLLSHSSKQENLWGINLYPQLKGEDFIEFDSMINVRPSFGNSSRGIDNPKVREKIVEIVEKLVKK
ncbi:hypothetical protein A2630_00735 [Candidatus Woesebacteria bacterium RIFCSPHIGHO2_01_FULL_44_10]|uniref:Uncharacterized protein n=1 Tax=Candidatus Woesebacteria bacterium RIFCSPLOWO2_01_FULL_44_14 TaxID=1802525 RepID=A0A1F8C1Q2_9BACT|nr:MAG: hypothetical protein A2630_00735 [Candidatus Woesebacteria bacterium RIFCSPHIGHO2_01_FULL_44_10]OGM54352.1 MAG: hypothetical protein A3F62_01195 [Candidatus Woesebacteria bacterium RIFCSPHIGHO2_12_FULL_44_11]OGM70253.1 MAG: hypothetical protein A2975_04240 [Candidatus Woesebacteria bacterium RIFCSPLOWO2_01_FULL_44_14]